MKFRRDAIVWLIVVLTGFGAGLVQANPAGSASALPYSGDMDYWATVNTLLEFVDNQLNYPVPGEGEFTFVVGAVAAHNGDTLSLGVFQGSFLLDPVFRAQVLDVNFYGHFFPAVWYGNRTESYDNDPASPHYGRLFYRYEFTGGTIKKIDDDPQRVMTVVIRYKMTAFHGEISWHDGPSDFLVLDEERRDITGFERDIPLEFFDISLPVELTSFAAANNGQGVTLVWTTGSEDENLGFYLYRSHDGGASFDRITPTIIPGAGSSASAHFYQFDDVNVTNGETYQYKLSDVDARGKVSYHDPVTITVKKVTAFSLEANYPNPFNAGTVIRFALPSDSRVSLIVYDIAGRQVRTLVDGEVRTGEHEIQWDGRDQTGTYAASGLYFCMLNCGEFSKTIRLVLAK